MEQTLNWRRATLMTPSSNMRKTTTAPKKLVEFTIFEDKTATVDNITAINDARAEDQKEQFRFWLEYIIQRCEVLYGLEVCDWALSLSHHVDSLNGNDVYATKFKRWKEIMEGRLDTYEEMWRDPAVWRNNKLMEDSALYWLRSLVASLVKAGRTLFPDSWRKVSVLNEMLATPAARFICGYFAGEGLSWDWRGPDYYAHKRSAWRMIMRAHLDMEIDEVGVQMVLKRSVDIECDQEGVQTIVTNSIWTNKLRKRMRNLGWEDLQTLESLTR
jgi:hypothetical protein